VSSGKAGLSHRNSATASSSCRDPGLIATVGHQWRQHETFLPTLIERFDELFKLEELNTGPNCIKHSIIFEVFFQSQVTTSTCKTTIKTLNLKNQDYNYNIKKEATW